MRDALYFTAGPDDESPGSLAAIYAQRARGKD